MKEIAGAGLVGLAAMAMMLGAATAVMGMWFYDGATFVRGLTMVLVAVPFAIVGLRLWLLE